MLPATTKLMSEGFSRPTTAGPLKPKPEIALLLVSPLSAVIMLRGAGATGQLKPTSEIAHRFLSSLSTCKLMRGAWAGRWARKSWSFCASSVCCLRTSSNSASRSCACLRHDGHHKYYPMAAVAAMHGARLPRAGILRRAATHSCRAQLPLMAAARGCRSWLPLMAAANGCRSWLPRLAATPGMADGHGGGQTWLPTMAGRHGYHGMFFSERAAPTLDAWAVPVRRTDTAGNCGW